MQRHAPKLLEVLGISFVVLLVVTVLFFAGKIIWANVKVAQTIASLRAAGEPVGLADLTPKPIPPEDDAATYLRRAASENEAIRKDVHVIYDGLPEAEQEEFDAGQPSPAMVAAIRAALAAHPDSLPLLARAARCSDYYPQSSVIADTQVFMKNVLANVNTMRGAVRVLDYRVQLSLADGRPQEALSACLDMLRLARHFDREPMLTNYLLNLAVRGVAIRSANRILRAGPHSDAEHDSLAAELACHNLVNAYQQALRTERAFGLQSFDEMPSPFFHKADQRDYLDLIEAGLPAMSTPLANSSSHAQTATIIGRAGPLTKLVAPATQAMQVAATRTLAEMRCLRVLNELVRHEQHAETAKPEIADLGLPADVIVDPFDGKPLRVKKLADGWLVYTVGQNQKDDGGNLTDYQDVGLGPVQTREPESKTDNAKKQSP